LLITRPGELARRLDKLIRIGVHPKRVVNAFAEVADKVSSNVIWQVRSHFEHRNDDKGENAVRAFFPKGSIANIHGIPNTLPPIKQKHAARIVAICDEALNTIYARKESLGKVYVDPDLARFIVPSSVRSSSRSLNVVGRGTRIPIVTGDTVRFFVWWKDGIQRTDIDLSAVLLNEKYERVGEIAYTNLRGYGAVHSGDITSAPNGASEYVDVSLKQLKAHNIRYVVMVLNSYSEQPFSELPECFAGVMGRESAQSGEVYEPRTVDNIFDITSDTRIAIPLIIDVESAESVWTDLALNHNPSYSNNVVNNSQSIALTTQTILNIERASLFDLFSAHANARGVIVDTPEEADFAFTATGGKISVPATEILSEYL
jgi:stress response protein SCP2